jgi:hypothetical protein
MERLCQCVIPFEPTDNGCVVHSSFCIPFSLFAIFFFRRRYGRTLCVPFVLPTGVLQHLRYVCVDVKLFPHHHLIDTSAVSSGSSDSRKRHDQNTHTLVRTFRSLGSRPGAVKRSQHCKGNEPGCTHL